jgi:FkbM family methyltransferase
VTNQWAQHMATFEGLVKDAIRRVVRVSGYDIVKWHRVPPDVAARKRLLDGFGIDTVLDVGANAGQFGSALREPMGYRGRIVSFEPLADAFAGLKCLADEDATWEAHNIAIGELDGALTLHVSKNRVSSSFLEIRETSTSVEPQSAYESECLVKVRSLDSLLPELGVVKPGSRIMLKLDTQGFESRVIAGARESLSSMSLVQMELSLVRLYDDEVLFLDMCNQMRSLGFDLISLDPGFADVATGRLLQVDGIFARPPMAVPAVRPLG